MFRCLVDVWMCLDGICIVFGLCLDVFGWCLDCAWIVFGLDDLDCVWSVFGLCLVYVWIVFGLYLDCIWIVLVYIWSVFGLYFVQCLINIMASIINHPDRILEILKIFS